jgi:hypothetical protein
MTSSKAGGLLGEPLKTARVFLSQAAPVLGIPAEYIRLSVKVITTLTLPLQRGGNNIAKFQFSFYMTGV